MNLDAIRAKLDDLNKSSEPREKVDYSKIYWNPSIGNHEIRIVPSAYDPANPFSEVKMHYNVGKYPMAALSNYGKQDPIEEFVAELKKTNDKDNWSLAGKLNPRTRYFAPVIVRGEEDMGVRLWSFGVNIYKALLSLAADEEIGDFTDVMSGTDIKLEKKKGNPYPETTIRPKRSDSVLSEDNEKVALWLKEQPNALEVQTELPYDFIKKQLTAYINGGEAPTEAPAPAAKAPVTATSNVDTSLPESLGQQKTDFTVEAATAGKQDTVSKFDDLFNE